MWPQPFKQPRTRLWINFYGTLYTLQQHLINMKISRILAALSLAFIASQSMATPASDLLEKLKKTYPNIPFSTIAETPVPGIYEVDFGKDMLYVEPSGTYFFPTMVNMRTRENLGDQRRAEINKVNFSDLPLSDAIKIVQGTGERQIAVFSDPNCSYCKKLEKVLADTKDVTVHVFPVAILSQDSTKKVKSLSCAKDDKAKLWRSMMVDGLTIPDATCDESTASRNLALFQKLGLQGTPGIILQNGLVIKGFVEQPKLDELLAKK